MAVFQASRHFRFAYKLTAIVGLVITVALIDQACGGNMVDDPQRKLTLNATIHDPVIEMNQITQVTATEAYPDGTTEIDTYSYTSTDPSIAFADFQGVVKGVKDGKTTIIVHANELNVDASVNVEVKTPVDRVTNVCSDDTIFEQDQVTCTASAYGSLNQLIPNLPATFGGNCSFATFTQTGTNTATFTGNTPGTCPFGATIAGKTGTFMIVIDPEPALGVTLNLASSSLEVGKTTTATGKVFGKNGRVLTRPLVFVSQQPAFATAAPDPQNPDAAILTAVAQGAANIMVSSEGKSATAILTVVPKAVANILLVFSRTSFGVGQTATVTATPRAADGSTVVGAPVTFSLSNSNATFILSPTNPLQGTLLGNAPGTVILMATSGPIVATQGLSITPNIASIVVTLGQPEIEVTETTTATAMAFDPSGAPISNVQFTFSSTGTPFATVNSAGVVTGNGVGTPQIQASAGGVTGSAPLSVVAKSNFPVDFVAAAAFTTYAISAGQLFAWGRGVSGQLGIGSTPTFVSTPTLVTVSGLGSLLEVSGGIESAVVRDVSGNAATVGYNFDGQICDGTRSNRPTFFRVTLPGPARQVIAGARDIYFILEDGRVYGCGANDRSQLGAQYGQNELLPVLVYDGVQGQAIAGGAGNDWVQLLVYNGTSNLWLFRGFNNQGQAGNGTQTTVTSWYASTIPPQSGSDAVQSTPITSTQASQLILDMENPVSTGYESRCYDRPVSNLLSGLNRQEYCTGYNNLNEISDASVLAILTPSARSIPATLGGRALTGIRSIRQGFTFTKIVLTDGTLLFRGFGFYGQAGNGDFANQSNWVVAGGGLRIVKESGGPFAYIDCVVNALKTLRCWGRNEDGQVGTIPSLRVLFPFVVRR